MQKNGKHEPKYFSRRRIANLFCAALSEPLTLIVAPAGYGKTISLQSFLKRRNDLDVSWIPAGESKQGPKRWESLFDVLFGAAGESCPVSRTRIPRRESELEQAAALLRREAARPRVVVLDAYENSPGDTLERFLIAIARRRIPNLTFFVLSRDFPRFAETDFFYSDCCNVLLGEALAFTREETRELFAADGHAVPQQAVDRIWESTRGWPAALFLVLKSYERGAGQIAQEWARLAEAAFLEKRESGERELLSKLAVFPQFTLEQAAFVTQDCKIRFRIGRLLREGALLKFDGAPGRYVLHPILRLAAAGPELRALETDAFWQRCARWEELHGNETAAIRFYAKAHDVEAVCGRLEKPGAAILADSLPAEAQTQIQVFSDREKLKYPFAVLAVVYRLLLYEDSGRALAQLQQIQELFQSQEKKRKAWEEVLGDLAVLQGFARVGELDAFDSFQNLAERAPRPLCSRLFARMDGSLLGSPSILWRYARTGVTLDRTAAGVQEAFRTLRLDPKRPLSPLGGLARAEAAYYAGRLEEAEQLVYPMLGRAKAKRQYQILGAAYFILARIGMLRGDDGLDAYLEELEAIRQSAGSGALAQCAALFSLQYIAACLRIPREDGEGQIPNPDAGLARIVRGSVLLAERKPAALEAFARNMLQTESGNLFGQLYGGIYLACALEQENVPEEAVWALEEALRLAQPDEICVPFVEHAPFLRPILRRSDHPFARRIEERGDWIGQICGRFLAAGEKTALTDEEKRIIFWYADGLEQRSIAQGLHLSMTETRRALRRVYQKAGTTDIRQIAKSVL